MAENGNSVMSGNYRVVGTRPIRHDGVDKVVGAARYAADQNVTGMLYGKYLRSPHAHARILNIDTSKAEALPGVTAIVTSADLAEAADKIQEMGEDAVNLRYLSANMLAHDKVLYHGHAIAAVAATSVHVAEEACGLIDVEYEVLKPVLDVREAMADDAPILLEELRTVAMGEVGDKPTNVAQHFRHARGDLEAGYEALPTQLSSASSRPRWSIRATWSPRHRPCNGGPTTRFTSGPAPRDRFRFGTRYRPSCRWPFRR